MIFEIHSLVDSQGNCLGDASLTGHLTSSALVHYLVKSEDSK